ncbi:ABC transporter ATP-binding protein [Bosea lathyri]|uniref:NitT/TauT family transport system ATP-binding protein n=1 Tax=Bosea lathyri TaxID=1036778 RepID=A0A1H6C948_9HYPH|nr:ABC transporter ATP-binding protein [Bosea lathyri]SEG69500.1 NitT/TauT family transport system ATP-binding protein [Bosea lathyri]
MKSIIALEDVSKRFGPFTALESISLDVAEGEFVSIVGTSGCGKSTLLRLVAGLMPTSGGSIRIADREVTGPTDDVGIAFQTPVLLPWRNVRQNIELPLEVRKLDVGRHQAELTRMIDLVGLRGFEDRHPYQLSGGMQQRVALCRALIHDPSLVLMDEPFGALDAMTREQMNLEIQRIWMETKKTIVLITHSIIEAVFLADRIVVMQSRPGRIASVIDVKLPRPRSFTDIATPEFQDACNQVRLLMNATGFTE